ncbi:hypothetical protein E4665_00270 [Sporolactobacillus shoreae]|uniref:HPr family phosphocarrier protein n=1 Tax=Sporolactobacillus shoreae TaxID=1465501 RepID=A0A4Z0GU64_9BACL|nr:hypothetical protein [Sporolactobacillus shoreae]TGB00147.1 hypothetical protein E4665_00270 [Sporolactobacillus shoreae]
MRNIISFKFNPSKLKLNKFIDFYGYCAQWDQNIYIYGQTEAHKVHRLSELLSFILFNHDEECLIVIEGSGIPETKEYISKHLSGVMSA